MVVPYAGMERVTHTRAIFLRKLARICLLRDTKVFSPQSYNIKQPRNTCILQQKYVKICFDRLQ